MPNSTKTRPDITLPALDGTKQYHYQTEPDYTFTIPDMLSNTRTLLHDTLLLRYAIERDYTNTKLYDTSTR